MSVSEVCDWYLEEAEAGRILDRNRRAIKPSTLKMDRSRIETHIKPLLGARLVTGLALRDIEGMQADIAAGKSARGRKAGRGGKSTGGSGVASRTAGTLCGLLGHAARLNVIGKNPAAGVRQLAVKRRQRRLSDNELRHFGQVMRTLAAEDEHPTGLTAIRCFFQDSGGWRFWVFSGRGLAGVIIVLAFPTRTAAPKSGCSEPQRFLASRGRRDGRARRSRFSLTGGRALHWGSSGAQTSLHEGKARRYYPARSSPHIC
jgi:hypothetical protein